MVHSIAAQAERLRHTPWRAVIGAAWLTLLGCVCLTLILPAGLAQGLRPLLKIAPLLPFMAKDLSHLPDALARTRVALALRDRRARLLNLLAAWLPPEFVGLLRLGRATRRGFVNWLLRRPQAALPHGRQFAYLELGAYRTAIAIVLIATLFEIPLDAALVPLFVKSAHERHLIHLLMLVGCLSSLVWVLGDRWLVGAGRHVLDDDALHLRVGARTTGTIPRGAILDCRLMNEPVPAWCARHGVERRRTLLASPLDKPNTVLILDSDSPVRLTHLGLERAGLACVFLYLDRPADLAASLAAA